MLDYYFCEECETYHHPNRIINGQVFGACECEISTESGGLALRSGSPKMSDFNIQNSQTATMNNLNRQINNKGVKFTYQAPYAQTTQRVVNVVPINTNTGYRLPLENIREEKQSKINKIEYLSKRTVSPQITIISPRNQGPELGRLRQVNLSPTISRAVSRSPTARVNYFQPLIMEPVATKSLNIISSPTPIQSINNIPQQVVSKIQSPFYPTQIMQESVQTPGKLMGVSKGEKINMKSKNRRFTLERVSRSNNIEEEDFQQDQQRKCCGKVFYS